MEINAMTMDQVDEEIRSINFEEEGADINALEQRMNLLEARKDEIIAQAEARREELESVASAPVTNPVVEETIMEEQRRFTTADAEYRDAFYSMLRGEATEEQRTTLINVDGDGNTIPADAIAIPKTLDTKIWDNIHTQHPILADITTIASGIVMEVTKHTAIATRVSGKKDAATTADAENNTFVKVQLVGVDYEKYVMLTYAEAKMSNGAMEQYLAEEISAELGEALAKDVYARILSDATTAQKVTATTDLFADIKSALGKANMGGAKVIYAPSSKYYDIVGAVKSGSPFNMGTTLGCQVKLDDAFTDIVVVDPKAYVLNLVQALVIESDKDIKKHQICVSGYMRAEGCLRYNKAAAYIPLPSQEINDVIK